MKSFNDIVLFFKRRVKHLFKIRGIRGIIAKIGFYNILLKHNHNLLCHALETQQFWGGHGSMLEDIEDALNKYSKMYPSFSQYRSMHWELYKSYLKYGVTPTEYFCLGFYGKQDSFRQQFLVDKDKDILSIKYSLGEVSGIEVYKKLSNKYDFYLATKDYFKREVIKFDSSTNVQKLVDFCKEHMLHIVKPLCGSLGNNTFIKEVELNNIDEYYKELSDGNEWILEELVHQSAEMASWNSSSVNTVRIPSIRTENGFDILQPFFRSGRKGNVVDNGGSGGIFACVDINSGKVISQGFDEYCFSYKEHPDSHKQFVDSTIPDWQELIALSREIHSLLPSYHKYVAFDFAHTDNGWVLIEGNWGQFLGQYASKVGIKREFESLMKS